MNTDLVVDSLKSALVRIGTEGVMSALVTAAPFFGLPVIHTITKYVVESILKFVVNETELGAYFLYVDRYTKAQAGRFEEAALKNQEAQKYGTEEEKRLAEEELIRRARELIKYGH